MTEPAQTPSLISKLAQVMGEVERIPKHGHNAFHNYDYATEADITAAIRQKLAAQRVMVIPSVQSVHREGTLTTIYMLFTFHDGDSPQTIEVPWAGVGDDKSDKGIWKAMTGAVKYLLLKSFLIPTGDDPEQDSEQPPAAGKRATNGKPVPPAPARPAAAVPPVAAGRPVLPTTVTVATISDAQRKRFFAISKEHGWTDPEVKALIKRVLNVDSSKDIPTHRYKEIVKMLEAGVDALANGQTHG